MANFWVSLGVPFTFDVSFRVCLFAYDFPFVRCTAALSDEGAFVFPVSLLDLHIVDQCALQSGFPAKDNFHGDAVVRRPVFFFFLLFSSDLPWASIDLTAKCCVFLWRGIVS